MLAELRTERENLEQAIRHLATPGIGLWQTPGPSVEVNDSGEASRQAAGEQEQSPRTSTGM